MNIITKLINDAIITLLRTAGKLKKVYPAKLRSKRRAEFIEKIKKHNEKGDMK